MYSMAVRRITLRIYTGEMVVHESLDHLNEGDQLAKYQPEVDHLGVGGERQLLHHACEDCRHHQHVGQVHRKSCFI